jgi:opacity protein-like surface antigen
MKRTVLLLALAVGVMSSQVALGQSKIEFGGIGASFGYVSPEDLGGTFGLGVFADLGQITPQIKLEPCVDYWSSTEEAYGVKASIRDISVGARGKYFFEVKNTQMRPFAGLGLGMHFLNAETSVTIPGFPTISSDASETKLGIEFGGGMETALSPQVDLHANLWYGIVSSASTFSLRLGLSHKFGG